jgi:uncharacterized protein YnzC (UPF0291/DUF896 family)
MKEIIGKNDFVFSTRSRNDYISRVRQQIYHDMYEVCANPQKIVDFLKREYNFSVNRSTVYYSWYKVKTVMRELDSKKFIEKYGNNMSTEELLDRYLLHHLSKHVETSYKNRTDIIQKINELVRKYEGLA